MACAVAGRDCKYFTFGNKKLAAKLEMMHNLLQEFDVCVAEVWKFVIEYCRGFVRSQTDDDVCKFIIEKCNAL